MINWEFAAQNFERSAQSAAASGNGVGGITLPFCSLNPTYVQSPPRPTTIPARWIVETAVKRCFGRGSSAARVHPQVKKRGCHASLGAVIALLVGGPRAQGATLKARGGTGAWKSLRMISIVGRGAWYAGRLSRNARARRHPREELERWRGEGGAAP